jgi:hypothetical protein
MSNKKQRVARANIADSQKNVNDGLKSATTGMGTANDKRSTVQYAAKTISPAELDNAYRYDWIAGKAIDIPADDATREWRCWQADQNQIAMLEAEERRLKVQECVHDALIKSRIYGGAAIVIGVKGQNSENIKKELKPESIGKGGLLYLHAVSRYEISAGEIDRDLLSPYYGEPKYYNLNSESGSVEVHPSRVVRFLGRKIQSHTAIDDWGDSIICRIDDAVKNASIPQEQVATLLMESNVDIIRIPDFMNSIGNADYESKLISRWQLAAVGKSINRALIMDKDEEWNKLTPNFSNLAELIRLYISIAASSCDIPAARFVGQIPGGLNSTGDSDTRNYYDMVKSNQSNVISPAMHRLDQCIITSAIGSTPKEVYYKWNPLWQVSENERADILLKKSQAIVNIRNTQLIPDEVMSKSVVNLLIEDESLPGLDSAMKEYEQAQMIEPDLDESDPEIKEQFNGGRQDGTEEGQKGEAG